ncbi:MFS transporter [Nostoc sp.]|uniref:MFS transporter n=1 Tax=Nostoc sp. TaxID=1180 RepID=UPI00359379DD
MPEWTTAYRIRVFNLIWLGQVISIIGSTLTSFALGVWVYQNTDSVTQYALISLCTILPAIVISPLAGSLVDRWDRRWVMIISDSGSGLSTLAIAPLLLFGRLEIWHIYLAAIAASICGAFQMPAYTAMTTLLVPKEYLGRASGMSQLGLSVARLISPLLAGLLIETIQMQGVILLDFTTFLFALLTLLLVRVPNPKTTSAHQAEKSSLLEEAAYGWNYIMERPSLLGLLTFFAISNFLVGVIWVLATPLVLSFTSATVLGIVLSIGGSGMLIGSLVMSAWGGPQRRVEGMLGFSILGGLCIAIAGLRPSAWLFGVAVFLFFLGRPIIGGCNQVILQKKVAPDVQGRVFALSQMIAGAALPLAYLIAGPLADKVFEPLLATDGPLAGTIGKLIGVGSGRGIGLLFVVVGIFTMLTGVAAYQYPPLRLIEKELPDAIVDEAEAEIKI